MEPNGIPDSQVRVKKLVRRIFMWVLIGVATVAVVAFIASVVFTALGKAQQMGTAAASVTTWQPYQSSADQFAAQFPAQPVYTSGSNASSGAGTVYMHKYTAKTNTATFVVDRFLFDSSVDVSNPSAFLQSFLQGFVGSSGLSLVSATSTTSGQYSALDFLVEAPPEGRMQGRLVLVNHSVYMAAEAYNVHDFNEADYEKFLSSFALQ